MIEKIIVGQTQIYRVKFNHVLYLDKFFYGHRLSMLTFFIAFAYFSAWLLRLFHFLNVKKITEAINGVITPFIAV